MKRLLFADFADARGIRAGVETAQRHGIGIADAFTPFPVEGLGAALGAGTAGRRVRVFMLLGGLGAAAFAYGLEAYSAIVAYPFDAGGRPANSWPTFLLFPFELGVLSAAISGLIGLFAVTGLPRLNHPLFDVGGFDRASGDRFVLALAVPATKRQRQRLETALRRAGALVIREAEL